MWQEIIPFAGLFWRNVQYVIKLLLFIQLYKKIEVNLVFIWPYLKLLLNLAFLFLFGPGNPAVSGL